MQILVCANGRACCIYDEAIDLAALGPLQIRRASRVEPDREGKWFADLAPVCGPKLGPFVRRSAALAAERSWLEAHWAPS